jgi:hypothetical protein
VAFYPHTWILFFDDAKQEKLVQALFASKRPCMVRNRALIDFWMPGRSPRPGPLVRAADQAFRVAGRVEDYELLLPLATEPDLVLSGFPADLPRELLERHGAVSAIRLSFPAMPDVHVARLVTGDMQSRVDVFDSAADSQARRPTILGLDGRELLRGNPPVPIDISQRSDVLMLCPPTTLRVSPRTEVVRAFDEQGRIVARLLMPDAGRTQ